jgi:hypothetical protein
LVESYHTEFDRVCHKIFLNIGFGTNAAREQKDEEAAISIKEIKMN